MRPIKFRCWNGEKFVNVAAYARWKRGILVGNYNVVFDQFTGLKDSKLNDIYESDIVKIGEHLFVVIFEEGCFRLKQTQYGSVQSFPMNEILKHCDVIGSVHETPELLETK